VANFFSYFTMQSAIAATVLWTIGGITALRRSIDPDWLTSARVVVTTYQIVSGIVFAVITIQAHQQGFPFPVPWSSDVLHYVLPLYAIVDLLLAPGRSSPRWMTLRFILIFPAVWVAYTLVRGNVVGWYPYFFLDPAQVGPVESALYCALAGVLFVGVSSILVGTARALPSAPTDADALGLRLPRKVRG
jgi:hypothetical protein